MDGIGSDNSSTITLQQRQ